MTARRLVRPKNPVSVRLDGETLVAERGEPLAATLMAAGALALARSPKFHRPRGPSCLRAACDGCLARVDDKPNLMTCRVPAREGSVVSTQNALGSRTTDVLRMTDWFFPDGMNHHELFAGVPGLQSVMQSFARRVAGLGKLPAEIAPPRAAERVSCDVFVVGSGPSGMAAALAFSARGRRVTVVDDALEAGGTAFALGGLEGPFAALLREFSAAVAEGRVSLELETTVGAFFERDLLVVGENGARLVRAETTVLATGAHDGQGIFEGNDVPGVLSARAASRLLAYGVLVGERVACVSPDGPSAFAERFVRIAREHGAEVFETSSVPSEVLGSTVVEGAAFLEGGERVIYDLDAVVLDLPSCPSHELAVQAGATVRQEKRGYVVVPDARGRLGERVVGVGELVGTEHTLEAIRAEAERVASA